MENEDKAIGSTVDSVMGTIAPTDRLVELVSRRMEQRQRDKETLCAPSAVSEAITPSGSTGHPPWEHVICRLIDEAQERWGITAEIPREEVLAWLSSRMTHWTKAWPVSVVTPSAGAGKETKKGTA